MAPETPYNDDSTPTRIILIAVGVDASCFVDPTEITSIGDYNWIEDHIYRLENYELPMVYVPIWETVIGHVPASLGRTHKAIIDLPIPRARNHCG